MITKSDAKQLLLQNETFSITKLEELIDMIFGRWLQINNNAIICPDVTITPVPISSGTLVEGSNLKDTRVADTYVIPEDAIYTISFVLQGTNGNNFNVAIIKKNGSFWVNDVGAGTTGGAVNFTQKLVKGDILDFSIYQNTGVPDTINTQINISITAAV